MLASSFYCVPTEESFSGAEGRIELPDKGIEGVGATVPTWGLCAGGLWETMPSGGLGTWPATFMPILLAGIEDGIILDEEADMPSREAIIAARSW